MRNAINPVKTQKCYYDIISTACFCLKDHHQVEYKNKINMYTIYIELMSKPYNFYCYVSIHNMERKTMRVELAELCYSLKGLGQEYINAKKYQNVKNLKSV
jgi:hypothetical protein